MTLTCNGFMGGLRIQMPEYPGNKVLGSYEGVMLQLA